MDSPKHNPSPPISRRDVVAVKSWPRLKGAREGAGRGIRRKCRSKLYRSGLMTEYLLDTSALRGLPGAKLQELAKRLPLLVSPTSVMELFCHLDEPSTRHPSPDDAFRFRKANVLKCQHARMLGDAFAERAEAVGAMPVNPTEFVLVVFPQLLELLRASTSLSDLYRQTVRDPSGHQRRCADIAANTRRVLDFQEEQWRNFVGRVRDEVLQKYPPGSLSPSDSRAFANCVVRYASGLAEGMAQRGYPGAGGKTTPESEFGSAALWIGYILSRIRMYETKRGPTGTLVVDTNDFEDATILRHLDLDGRRVLVTEDNGTLTAVRETVAALDLLSKETETVLTRRTYAIKPAELIQIGTTS
jgi:hypothetical protein